MERTQPESLIDRLRRLDAEATPGSWEYNGTGIWTEATEPHVRSGHSQLDEDQNCGQCLLPKHLGSLDEPIHYVMALHEQSWWPDDLDAALIVEMRDSLPLFLRLADAAEALAATNAMQKGTRSTTRNDNRPIVREFREALTALSRASG